MACFIKIDTKRITNITSSSVTTGGLNILSTDPVVEKGVVYSFATVAPTINHTKKIVPGKGVSKFDITIDGLSGGFTYYIRAYAISNTGDISYGRALEVAIPLVANSVCNINVLLPPGKIYTIPDGYTLVGSDDNASLLSVCIDTTKLTDYTKECYGFTIMLVDGEPSAFGKDVILQGMEVNGTYYDFVYKNTDSPLNNSVPADTLTPIVQKCISSVSYLSQIISSINGILYVIDGGTQGDNLVITFKSSVQIKTGMLYYTCYGTPGTAKLSTPVLTFADLKSQTGIGETLTCS